MANKKSDNRRQQGSMNDHSGRQQSQETGRDHDRNGRAQPCAEIPALAGCPALGLAGNAAVAGGAHVSFVL